MVSRIEALQYALAEKRLEQLERRYQQKRNEVYDSVFGTRSVPDYDLGFMYVESVNPVEVAIYLVELEEEHEKEVKEIKKRIEVFNRIKGDLSESELNNIEHFRTLRKVQRLLKGIVPARENHITLMKRHDEEIEGMNDTELLEGYINFIEEEEIC